MNLGKKVYWHNDQIAAKTLAALHFSGSTPTSQTVAGQPYAVAVAAFHLSEWSGNGAGDPDATGTALHTLADTYAHTRFTAWSNSKINGQGNHPDLNEHDVNSWFGHVGHMSFGHDPDEPFRRPALALKAARTIFNLIPNRCGCGSGLDWATVSQDLSLQFQSSGSEEERCERADQMIHSRF